MANGLIVPAKFVLISVILLGFLLILVFVPCWRTGVWCELVVHFGQALIIAGVIGLIVELTEFTAYFEKRLSNLLVENRFLDFFSEEKLNSVGMAALRKHVEKIVSNPENEWRDCLDVVLRDLVPLLEKCYRKDFRVLMELRFIGADEIHGGGGDPKNQVAETSTVYEYDVISPFADKEVGYPIESLDVLKKIPGVSSDSQSSAQLWIDGHEMPVKEHLKISDLGAKDVEVKLNVSIKIKGACHVKFAVKDYELAETSGFHSVTMTHLTDGVNVTLSCPTQLKLDLELYGVGSRKVQEDITANMASFTYRGWMLPGDGYFIDWVQ